MKNQWTNYISGYVKVKAYGKGTERLINNLTRRGITVWDVSRHGNDALLFHMEVGDLFKLRQIVRKSDCKVTFLQGKGLPFIWKRVLKNSGFLVGIVAFLLCIFVLSNMIWGIEIHNAKPETEHMIRKELDRMGVKIGNSQFNVDDVDTIQRKLSDRIEVLTWVGVELKGTTYHFQVVEKQQPEKVEASSPQNLVAKKKAIISQMFVEKGKPIVKVNDYVGKGQLLVSGIIGTEKEPEIVPAKGIIKGQTWYKATVSIPLKTKFRVYDGAEQTQYYLNVWNVSIPVWGFTKPEYKQYEEDITVRPLHFLQWELPVRLKERVFRSNEEVTREYTEKDAMVEAKKMARRNLEKKLDEDAEIIGEKLLHRTIDNGKVTLSIHYQVIEDIAVGQSIFQGD